MLATGPDGTVYVTRRQPGDVVALPDKNNDGRLTRDEFSGAAATQSEAWKRGHDRGLIEGRQAGKEDRAATWGWDLEGQRELETADSGYDARFGPKAEYQAGYREGFRKGYREGFGPR